MIVGVIGSGSIGPDLAYGFASALGRSEDSRVYLLDIVQEALDKGVARIEGYVAKAVARGKLPAKAARSVRERLVPTLSMGDLADCEYVLEAATEDLEIKKSILQKLEQVVRPDCLIGFATSGIPRARIAAEAKRPQRCFVNHPFFPAWRALPIEVVLSGDEALGARMLDTLRKLGKVPVVTADVPCFAADDIFCNYGSEAARIVEEGIATPAQVDRIVDDAVGGGGPLNVHDLTKGNLLTAHCQELMLEGSGNEWFRPPQILRTRTVPWRDPKGCELGDADPALQKTVLERILAVLMARTYCVVDHGVCDASDLNWMTRNALGFRKGLLEIAADLGAERLHEICTAYAARNPGFEVPPSIAGKKLAPFLRDVVVTRDAEIAVVTIRRPEVRNALCDRTMAELRSTFDALDADQSVRGVVLSSSDGALAGADIGELAALRTPEEAVDKCRRTTAALDRIPAMSKPVVAAVDGPVLGGGAELSMACHARVTGPNLMLGQPEVNLGILPGSGGTQRLPRLIGLERALDLLRTGRSVGAAEACAWGWADGEPQADFLGAAKELVRRHVRGEVRLAPVDPAPLERQDPLPRVDIGHHSAAIDAILLDVLRKGLSVPLAEGLEIEAQGFGRCKQTVDYDIGMKNFIQNGPRVPAVFLNE